MIMGILTTRTAQKLVATLHIAMLQKHCEDFFLQYYFSNITLQQYF